MTAPNPLTVTITSDVQAAIYLPRQEVTWLIHAINGDIPLAGPVAYAILDGTMTKLETGTVQLTQGKAAIRATRSTPGVLLLQLTFHPPGHPPLTVYGGAAFAPKKITPSAPRPRDFDEFWSEKLAELQRVPMNIKLEPVDSGDPNFQYFKVTLDNIRGTRIYGQLAKPAGQTNLPAIIQHQWGGVYPSNPAWVLGHARKGWLAMNISAHDLPIDQPPEFYKQKADEGLADYYRLGMEDRETSYYLRMLLACYRSTEYLKQHPDFNGRSLVATGASQGGYLSIATAALNPAITAIAGVVPAYCDYFGRKPDPNRSPAEQQIITVSHYFDAMNLASRVRCPALIGVGLLDTGCLAEGVLAMCNQLHGPTQVILMPQATHGTGHQQYHQASSIFMETHKN
jgi:cephalosporin-C deacetylase